jgi:hypothetical protein
MNKMNTIDEENRFSECTPHPVNAVNPVGKVFSAPSAPLREKILAKMDDSHLLQRQGLLRHFLCDLCFLLWQIPLWLRLCRAGV